MKFVKSEDLKPGMRLAKPIYNKNGVLLYDRNSALTIPGINSVKNFGLIGIYILEPAEPLPPLTREDLEFEQCQTVYMFQLRDSFNLILKQKKVEKIMEIIHDIINRFGKLDHRVNFNQNLRSADDFIYKHAISTAILSALISNHMHINEADQLTLVGGALVYDFGLSFVPRNILEKGNHLDPGEAEVKQQALEKGLSYLAQYGDDYGFMIEAYKLIQYHLLKPGDPRRPEVISSTLVNCNEILKVAIKFDTMTGMNLGEEPVSEIQTMKYFEANSDLYDPRVVQALAKSIHIIPAGASVDLSTGDKGIILVENTENFMQPLLLRLSNNLIYDLSDSTIARHIKIKDIMKTMDNRIEVDEDTLKYFVADERIKETADRFRMGLYGHI